MLLFNKPSGKIALWFLKCYYTNKLMPTLIALVLSPILFVLTTALTILVTVLCSIPITIAGIIKLLLPIPFIWRYISSFADFMMWCWCQGLSMLMRLNVGLKWEIDGLEDLSKENWYLVISNHKSWTDIVVLCVLLRNHIPMNKYFWSNSLLGFLSLALPAGLWICRLWNAIRAAIYWSILNCAVKILKPHAAPAKNFACARPPLLILSKDREALKRSE